VQLFFFTERQTLPTSEQAVQTDGDNTPHVRTTGMILSYMAIQLCHKSIKHTKSAPGEGIHFEGEKQHIFALQ